MLSLALYQDLLGKPYAKDGRGPTSYDCLGLAMEMARRLGKPVPAYVSDEEELHRQLGAGSATLADVPQIARAVPGCVALFRMSDGTHHLGVMVDPYRMLHAARTNGAVIVERVLSPQWQRKIIGYYSLEGGK
jgi:cell wall-associated NlpC family hydrolase